MATEKFALGAGISGGEWHSDSDEEEFFRREAEEAQMVTGSQAQAQAGAGEREPSADPGLISSFLQNVTVE